MAADAAHRDHVAIYIYFDVGEATYQLNSRLWLKGRCRPEGAERKGIEGAGSRHRL
jgi:hypothetical protein